MFLLTQLTHRLQTEQRHWRLLPAEARALLGSISVYEFVYPIIHTFVNTFLLRNVAAAWLVAVYNVGIFVALPVVFFLNGAVLRRVSIKYLYSFGMLGQPLVVLLLFWFSWQSWWQLLLLGMIQGSLWGWYWANRNFLSLHTTEDHHRNYFVAIETILATLAAVITPLAIGWFIKGAEFTHWWAVNQAYQLLAMVALVALSLTATFVVRAQFVQPHVKRVLIKRVSPEWWAARWLELWRGFRNGLDLFLPALLVFAFLGRESTLGTIQSVAALVSVTVLYTVGRKITARQRYPFTSKGVWVGVVLALLVGVTYSQWSVLVYLLLAEPLFHFIWLASNPMTERVIELQDEGDPGTNYAYIADRELWLNFGRIGGVMLFGVLTSLLDMTTAMRIMITVMGIAQLIFLYFLKKIV